MAMIPMRPQDTMAGNTPPSAPEPPVASPFHPSGSSPIKFSGKSPGGDDFTISIDFSPSTD